MARIDTPSDRPTEPMDYREKWQASTRRTLAVLRAYTVTLRLARTFGIEPEGIATVGECQKDAERNHDRPLLRRTISTVLGQVEAHLRETGNQNGAAMLEKAKAVLAADTLTREDVERFRQELQDL
jgi:hypothetical protein